MDPHDVFEAWLAGSRYAGVAPGAVARIDLDAFVRDSGEVPLSPAERLRSLGVHLQRRRGPAPPPHALDRVFEAATRLAPDDARLWYAWGVWAEETSRRWDPDADPERDPRARLAARCFLRAREVGPEHAFTHYGVGLVRLERGDAQEALACFDRAVELDPSDPLAHLYRAYALWDLERFADAVEAFEAVPLEGLRGKRAWRVDEVLEETARCRLLAGDPKGARRDYERLVERFEKEPRRIRKLDSGLIDRVLEEHFAGPLLERYRATCVAAGLV